MGNAIVDIVARVDALPEPGADVLASGGALAVGGSGYNTLVAASRLGLSAAYAGPHGTGPLGDLVRSALATEGIAQLLDTTPNIDTGFDVVLVEESGERSFVTVAGAERSPAPALGSVDPADTDAVHVSGYGLVHPAHREATGALLGRLPKGTTLLYDPGPLGHRVPEEAVAQIFFRASWWSGTEREAVLATGASDVRDAARILSSRLARGGVIVRRGAAGCLLADSGSDPVDIPGFPVIAVDTNGAGDAHAGAFLAALSRGDAPKDAARFANLAAALSVTRRGPATAPDREEVDEYLAR